MDRQPKDEANSRPLITINNSVIISGIGTSDLEKIKH